MSTDVKTAYSKAAQYNLENISDENIFKGYQASKSREEKHNEEWLKHKVNINDIVEVFAPTAAVDQTSQKLIFRGSDYTVIADLNAGYLRIQNKDGKYVQLDGSLGKDEETHFKIKTREEM